MWFFSDPTPQNNADAGRWAVAFFHNKSIYYPGYNVTLDQLIAQVAGRYQTQFLEGLGKAIHAAEMDTYQVREAMEQLAAAGAGRIPKGQDLFFAALYDRVGGLTARDWLNEAPSIVGDSALVVAEGAAEVGNAAIDLGKSLTQFAPLALFIAAAFILYAKTRQIAGR